MVSFLKIFLGLVWLFMVYMVVSTSLESSLFQGMGFFGLHSMDEGHIVGFLCECAGDLPLGTLSGKEYGD